ncbi:UPF0134 protein [Frankliniella fusca]|uniref:UPF0134 protein n=1 Tax=Frankliniella fusca TaxID=407009 RepID=A0AAE1H5I3_9NEOP|nr:UPF0134 protein [Frankliniella fusca]
MARQGSETCPIDLTGDEAYTKKIKANKKKHKKKREKRLEVPPSISSGSSHVKGSKLVESNLISKRLDEVEAKFQSVQNVTAGQNFAVQTDTNTIENQCDNLEHRIDKLENFVKLLAEAFNVNDNQLRHERISATESPLTVNSNSEVEIASLPPNDADTIEELVQTNEADNSCLDMNSNSDNLVLGEIKVHESFDCDKTLESSLTMDTTSNNLASSDLRTDEMSSQEKSNSILDSVEVETVQNLFSGNCMMNNNAQGEPILNQEDLPNINEDLKPLVLLPPLTSIKEEVNYLRDDQGRILMYLYCAFKKINKTSPKITAVSGMYLTESLHNEFTFQSERGLAEVRVEAEIRAALCGIEVVKSTFSSLADVCVMIISSCSWAPFVKAMKADNVYPSFYCCSCVNRNCAHSENRWRTDSHLGKTQIDILPDLILAKKDLKVHWCKLDQISKEELEIFNSYKPTVDGILEVITMPGIDVTPIQR